MNRKLVHTLFLMVLMAMITLSASVARADSLNIVFDPASVSGFPGDTVSFYATISAPSSNSGPVDLIGDTITLPGPFSIDDCCFLSTPPTMNPGDVSSLLLLFNVTIDPSAVAYNSYTGFYTITGPQGDPRTGELGTGTFQVNVVPEPASMLLLGSGLSGLVGVIRRKRQS